MLLLFSGKKLGRLWSNSRWTFLCVLMWWWFVLPGNTCLFTSNMYAGSCATFITCYSVLVPIRCNYQDVDMYCVTPFVYWTEETRYLRANQVQMFVGLYFIDWLLSQDVSTTVIRKLLILLWIFLFQMSLVDIASNSSTFEQWVPNIYRFCTPRLVRINEVTEKISLI